MTSKLHPHFNLLQQHCLTLREATSTANRTGLSSNLRRIAGNTIQAIEPLAIDLLDEEYARVPRVQEVVYSSGSLQLARHASAIIGTRPLLTPRTWRIAAHIGSASYIEGLFSEAVSPNGLGAVLLEMVLDEDVIYLKHLLPRVAGLDQVFDLGRDIAHRVFRNTASPDEAAEFLRIQVRAFPESFRKQAMNCALGSDLRILMLLFLAGAVMPEPMEKMPSAEVHAFLKLVHSNHGRLEALSALGSLEDALKDCKTTERLFDQLQPA